MTTRTTRLSLAMAMALLAGAAGPALSQGAAPPTPAPPDEAGAAGVPTPKVPLPPRDTPRAAQPGQNQRAAVPVDADWPCVQRKVGSLSYGQMWSGPPIEGAAAKAWRDDREIEALASTLVARRTSIDEAKAAIADFAAKAGDKKSERLTSLFAATFDELNGQRSRIVDGIERYARKQRSLSERIKDESLKIAETQKDMASQMSPEGQQQQDALNWDTRVYEERTQSLTYVCETPVILEQRAFDLGREIQGALN